MRRFWVGFMLFWAVLLLVVSSFATWIHSTVISTSGFVGLTTDVLESPEVQNALAEKITAEIFAQPQVEQAVAEVIPDPLKQFQGPIVSGAEAALQQGILFVAGSEVLGNLLEGEIERMHDELVNGQDVTIGLSDVAAALGLTDKGGIVGSAANLIPSDFGTITVLSKQDYPWIYQIIDVLKSLWLWFLIAALALFAGAIAVSRRRRKTIYTAGLSILIVYIVLIVALQIGRSFALGSLPSDVSQGAADSIVDIVLGGLRSLFIWMALIGLGVFVVGLAWGHAGIIPATRRYWSRARENIKDKRARKQLGLAEAEGRELTEEEAAVAAAATTDMSRWARFRANVGEFAEELEIAEHIQTAANYVDGQIRMLRGVGVIAAALIVLLWPGATATVVIWIGALLVLYLGALEILAGRAEARASEAQMDAQVAIEAAASPGGAAATQAQATPDTEAETEPALPKSEAKVDEEPEPKIADPEERMRLLRELGDLKKDGVLDDDEFATEKARVLG